MLTVNAYAATSPSEPLVRTTITRRDVGPRDVLIEIAYAGVCHSDIHTVRGDWGPITYPQVFGHEVAGTVVEVGPDVTKHAVGDRVGVGTIVNSCRECDNCRAGEEQYCLRGNTQAYCSVDRDGTITQGGYSSHVVVDEDYVLRLPPRSTSARSPRCYGADAYYATSDPASFDHLANSFDLIINTVSVTRSTSTPTCGCCAATAPWSVSAHPPSRSRSPCSPSSVTGAPSPDRPPVASLRRRRCWTSAPSKASCRRPSSSTCQPSTTPTSVSSAPTSATASSSTPPACTRPAKPAPRTKSLGRRTHA